MNHQQYKEWLTLLAYEELEGDQKNQIEEHLSGCEECRHDWEQIKKFNRVIDTNSAGVPSEGLLRQARLELRAALRIERNRVTFGMRIREWFSGLVPDYRVAAGFAAMLVIGLVIGSLYSSSSIKPVPSISNTLPQTAVQNAALDSDVTISNIRFLDANTTDGQVEFAFDAVRPMRVKGSVDDKRVQEILTYALVREQNPGVRLRAVSTMGTLTQNGESTEVKKALITALTSDSNDGVRKEALAVLKTMPFDPEIQAAFIYVLSRDQNAALRIDAIKSLEGRKIEDEAMISVLKEKMESDDNGYIRRRAKAVLEEVTRQ